MVSVPVAAKYSCSAYSASTLASARCIDLKINFWAVALSISGTLQPMFLQYFFDNMTQIVLEFALVAIHLYLLDIVHSIFLLAPGRPLSTEQTLN